VQGDKGVSPKPESDVKTQDIVIPTDKAKLPARVYMPEG
jgi:hypothetical protein